MLRDFLGGFRPSAGEGAVINDLGHIWFVSCVVFGIRACGWTVAGLEMMGQSG